MTRQPDQILTLAKSLYECRISVVSVKHFKSFLIVTDDVRGTVGLARAAEGLESYLECVGL